MIKKLYFLQIACLIGVLKVVTFPSSLRADANPNVDLTPCSFNWQGTETQVEFDVNGHFTGPNPWLLEYATASSFFSLFVGVTEKNLDVDPPNCPAMITLHQVAPEFTTDELSNFCLHRSQNNKSYIGFGTGEKDLFGNCSQRNLVCQRVANLDGVKKEFKNASDNSLGSLFMKSAGFSNSNWFIQLFEKHEKIKVTGSMKIFSEAEGYKKDSLRVLDKKLFFGKTLAENKLDYSFSLPFDDIFSASINESIYFCWK